MHFQRYISANLYREGYYHYLLYPNTFWVKEVDKPTRTSGLWFKTDKLKTKCFAIFGIALTNIHEWALQLAEGIYGLDVHTD